MFHVSKVSLYILNTTIDHLKLYQVTERDNLLYYKDYLTRYVYVLIRHCRLKDLQNNCQYFKILLHIRFSSHSNLYVCVKNIIIIQISQDKHRAQ